MSVKTDKCLKGTYAALLPEAALAEAALLPEAALADAALLPEAALAEAALLPEAVLAELHEHQILAGKSLALTQSGGQKRQRGRTRWLICKHSAPQYRQKDPRTTGVVTRGG